MNKLIKFNPFKINLDFKSECTCRGFSLLGFGISTLVTASGIYKQDQNLKKAGAFGMLISGASFGIINSLDNAQNIKFKKLEIKHTKAKHPAKKSHESISTIDSCAYADDNYQNNLNNVEDTSTWTDDFHKKNPFPYFAVPNDISSILVHFPKGFEDALFFVSLALYGALCFSKVRAKNIIGELHGPNLLVAVEGESGSGKGKLESYFHTIFERIIREDNERLNTSSEKSGINQIWSMSITDYALLNALAANQGLHAIVFEPEAHNAAKILKNDSGISEELIRKSFDGSNYSRTNNVQRGCYPAMLNMIITGTPDDIDQCFGREETIEGGTTNRVTNCCLPSLNKDDSEGLPNGDTLQELQDNIDNWRSAYCFSTDENGNKTIAKETIIDLSYVNEALQNWSEEQYVIANNEDNYARRAIINRVISIGLHNSIVIAMLFDNPGEEDENRQNVIKLALYVANYHMERYLHKYGSLVNRKHKKYAASEKIVSENSDTLGTINFRPTFKDAKEAVEKRLLEKNFGWGSIAKKWWGTSSKDAMKVKRTISRLYISQGLDDPIS